VSWDFDYCSTAALNSLLKENGLGMTKKFGQNFLINKAALEKIVSLSGAASGLSVWEVGPGIGALTSHLLATGAKVTAFEIDRGFCKILKEQAFSDEKNFTLVEGDALKTWKKVWEEQGTPDIICANLPYNVGSILIASFIENRCLPPVMVYTLQTEVVRRICALPGDADYSGFSVLACADYENSLSLMLKPGNFWPAPNVDSAVVTMKKRGNSLLDPSIEKEFFPLVRAVFSQRRKTVRNNLKALGKTPDQIEKALEKAGISPDERAENLSASKLAELTSALSE
jgi:16S rRNA (adenine1518-N6/adenine1519-N6)-dimethyltransferase